MSIGFFVAVVLAIVALQINGREGELPINMKDGFTL
jgi:hypothetical protein